MMPRPTRTATQSSTETTEESSPTTTVRRAARQINRANAQDPPRDGKRERTKDGCLTCRMRRKKCQTERTESGSCTTCHRLRIECYGFGAKRPDWMKDKALVDSKLQEIKDHLVAEGLVRGVAKDRSARRPNAVAPTTSPPPPPIQQPPSRPASPVIVPSRASPSFTRRLSPTQSRQDTAVVVPPVAPLSHPIPGRDNPQYLPSRAASRSPVLAHAPPPRSPIIPLPLQTTPPPQRDDSDSSDETSPQTPRGQFFSSLLQGVAASSSSSVVPSQANVVDCFAGMLSADPHGASGSDLLQNAMRMAYIDPSMMDLSSSMISDLLPITTSAQYSMPTTNTLIGPIAPPASYVPEVTAAAAAAAASGSGGAGTADQENGYYQDMENNFGLVIARGIAPNIASQIITQSWQSPFEAPWLAQMSMGSPRIRSLTPMPSHLRPQEDGFMYYFDHVATMQYIFDKSSTDTMHTHIQQNPTGVVATAIKMIAAVHDSQNRKANGLDAGGALRTSGTAEHLYRETYGQIMSTLKRSNGKLTEAEATAALHMISYWLFQGGDGQWAEALKIAVHWFQNVEDLYTKKGPQVIRTMTAQQRFAAKTTMWMDIFSSITQLRIPYLNGLYKHLLENSTGTNDLFGTTNGCCDSVMCSLAAIVTLETEMSRSSAMLSLMDEHSQQMEISMYINRANAIREHLLAMESMPRISEVTSYLVDDQFTPSAAGVPETSSSSSFETSSIFRHAALLYLSTVINGYSPSVPETFAEVLATHEALLALPPSSVDRSLVFPLCLAGCMTDDLLLRKYFSDRLRAMDGPVGNCGKTLMLMEEVWRRRDSLQLIVGWRDVMRETQLELLLV